MNFIKWIKKERMIWHKRFIPSLIAGVAVMVVTFFFQLTASNIVLFASLGASAAVLTHKYLHKLTILRTIIFSYLIALLTSLGVLFLFHTIQLPLWFYILITVTFVTLGMYLFNVFHPPATGASLAFILLDGGLWETTIIFISVILLLIFIKLLTYFFYYENLKIGKFWQEFKKIKDDRK